MSGIRGKGGQTNSTGDGYLATSLTLDPFALLDTLFVVLEVVLVSTLAIVQELCANTVVAAIMVTTTRAISMTRIGFQLTAVRIELRWPIRFPMSSRIDS